MLLLKMPGWTGLVGDKAISKKKYPLMVGAGFVQVFAIKGLFFAKPARMGILFSRNLLIQRIG